MKEQNPFEIDFELFHRSIRNNWYFHNALVRANYTRYSETSASKKIAQSSDKKIKNNYIVI